MNQILKTISVLGTVFIIIFSLIGCENGKKERSSGEKDNKVSSEYVYDIKYEDIENLSELSNAVVRGNTMYFTSYAYDEDSEKIVLSLQSLDFSSPQNIKTYASYENSIGDTDNPYTYIASFYLSGDAITYFKVERSTGSDKASSIDLGDIPKDTMITEEYIRQMGMDLKSVGLEFSDISSMTVAKAVELYEELTAISNTNAAKNITVTMITVDLEGNETSFKDVTSQINDNLLSLSAYDNDGYLYMYSQKPNNTNNQNLESFLTVFNLSSLESETIWLGNIEVDSMITTQTGEIAAAAMNEERNLVAMKWDKEQKKFIEMKDSDLSITGKQKIYPAGKDSFYYIDENFLHQYNIEKNKDETILNFLDCNILFEKIVNIFYMDEEHINIITTEGGFETPYLGLNRLIKVKASEIAPKTKITLACKNQSQNIRNAIIRFNKLNSDYKILITENIDYNEDMTQFHNDILSGNGPDLIDLSSMEYSKYKESGLFTDIYEYIKKDEDFSKKRLNENILKLFEQNEALIALPISYTVTALASAKNVLGDSPFTIDKFAELIENNPDKSILGIDTSREEILEKLLLYNQDYFIDYENKSCNFTDGNFEKILNIAKLFPSKQQLEAKLSEDEYLEFDEERVYEGRQLFYELKLDDLNKYQIAKYILKDDVRLSGYPSVDGGQPAVYISSDLFSDLFAININSKYKEECWEFIKILYKEAGQWEFSNGFPVDLDMLDEMLKKYSTPNMTTDENGNQEEIPEFYNYNNELDIEVYAFSEEEANIIRELAVSVSALTPQDDSKNFADIVSEEAEPFFEDKKPAKQVCDVIQSRINIFINEEN